MPFYAFEGRTPVVDPSAFIHPLACLIGEVTVAADCYIGPFVSLRADYGSIVVGEGSNVQDNCVVHVDANEQCLLESGAHIGHSAVLHGAHLEPEVLVGMGAIVLNGARIGTGSFVAANATVLQGFVAPARSMLMGTPAKVVREVDEAMSAGKRRGLTIYRDLARSCHTNLVEIPRSATEPR